MATLDCDHHRLHGRADRDRPGLADFNIHSLSALVAVAFITLREITTRRLTSDVPSLTVALSTATESHCSRR